MFKKEDQCRLTRSEIEERAADLLDQMTLKEKVWLLNGNWDLIANMIKHRNAYNPTPICTNGLARLGVPAIKFTDGPRGVVMGKSTCFPVSMARGASFDRDLERRIGEAIGIEARALGANFFGGVCINLLRHPAWGRAQETYGEDPYHLGEMGVALIEGVQAHNVIACLKHYAMNNIENSRFFVDVKADERTLREIYLPHFKKGVAAGAASLMGAYNMVAGEQACESEHLLTEILRDEWGFEGFTISDFIFGVRDTKRAIEAGLDVEMPMPIHYNQNLLEAVEEGRVAQVVVDRAALRVIKTIMVFSNCPDPVDYSCRLVANQQHIDLARETAEKSMVLIKNNNSVLPFDKDIKKILLLGRLADQENTGDHGSSQVRPPYVVTPLAGLMNYFGDAVEIIHLEEHRIEDAKFLAPQVDCVIIVAGNDFNDEGEYISPGGMDEYIRPLVEGYKNMGKPVKAAFLKMMGNFQFDQFSNKDGSPLGGDRQNLSLKAEEIAMIKTIGALNPRTVVCLVCGSMIMIDDWAESVSGILYAWYSGMEGGNALARILFGDANPSGKLPFTIPADVDHLPYFSSTDSQIEYDLYHGYSLLDKNGHTPAYPFGFGLSYTSFEYGDLQLVKRGNKVLVRVRVTNTGKRDGEEVVQVYVGMQNSKIERQKKLLKGFTKVFIPAGTSVQVEIPIALEEMRYYSISDKRWLFEAGEYSFMVGANSGGQALTHASLNIVA